MKKFLKSTLALFVAMLVVCSAFGINAFAAGSVITFSSSKVNVGDNVTVTISFKSDYDIVTSGATISYDASILRLVESDDEYGGGSGVIKMAHVGNAQKFVFKAIKAGNCTFKTYDCSVSDGNEDYSISGDSATLSVVDKTLSSNANLKSLRVSAGTLTPSFSKNVTSYSITIGPEVEQLTVGATTEDSDASVEVQGSKNMKFGENTRIVVVTAPNGTTKKYTLNITKLEQSVSSEPEETVVKPELAVNGEMLYVSNIEDAQKVSGFTASDYNFKGTTVKVLTNEDNGIILLNLVDLQGNSRGLYTYDATTDVAEKFEYIISAENMYVFAKKGEDVKLPAGFKESVAQINGTEMVVYVTEANDEFYLVYAKFNGSEPAFYLYDTVEKTLQRYVGGIVSVDTDVSVDEPNVDDKNFLDNILENKRNRLILIGSALVIGVVVLVLIIVLLVKSSKLDDYDEEDDDKEPFDFNFDDK